MFLVLADSLWRSKKGGSSWQGDLHCLGMGNSSSEHLQAGTLLYDVAMSFMGEAGLPHVCLRQQNYVDNSCYLQAGISQGLLQEE